MGWEHLEMVIGAPDGTPYNSQSLLVQFMAQQPELPWNKSGFYKHCNADVALPVGDLSVKFHACPLLSVIDAEIASGDVVSVPDNYFD